MPSHRTTISLATALDRLAVVLIAITLLAGPAIVATATSASALSGISVVGNQLVDGAGRPVRLHGVDRMSTEYACIQGWGIFSGPSDAASNSQTLDAMLAWRINAVRVPLNEDCWLGTKPGLNPAVTGANYRTAITSWVNQITAKGMVAIIDLHWAAPNGVAASGQQPMANRDNSPTFWASAASAFKNNPTVMFDLFNEPYLERDTGLVPTANAAWACWLNGCTLHVHDDGQNPTTAQYQAAGMQELVNAVRGTGATNPLLLGGLSYAQDFSQYLSRLPNDALHKLVVSFHAYPGNACGMEVNPCLQTTIATLMQTMPLVVGEFGRDDCTTTGIDSFLNFMDARGGSYMAWTWTVTGVACGSLRWDVISDYASGTPTVTGAGIRAHYLAAGGGPFQRPPADFDGSGTTDLSIFRPSSGLWAVRGGSPEVTAYGTIGDVPVPADYDGDAKADVAVFRPSGGVWFVRRSTGGDTALGFGISTDLPVPADYDGDGKADIAVFRPAGGTWYLHLSTGTDSSVGFGINGDVPVPADYDGDGKADQAVFRPSTGTWFVRKSTGGDISSAYGTNGDVPVPGDYDGDAKTDQAVFRPSTGTWFVHRSTGGDTSLGYGIATDVPVPGDYDRDAKTDVAVFRPGGGGWYTRLSSTGADTAVAYGSGGDIPLPLAPAVRKMFY